MILSNYINHKNLHILLIYWPLHTKLIIKKERREKCLEHREKHTKMRNANVVTMRVALLTLTPLRITAHTFVNELDRVLYPCHSEVQLYRPTSVVEKAAVIIDMIRTGHSSTDGILNMMFHLEIFDRRRYIPADPHYVVRIVELKK
jgi:hypothetical protein